MAIVGKLLHRLQLKKCSKTARDVEKVLAVYRGEFSFFLRLHGEGSTKERSTLLVVCQLCLLWFHA